MAERAGVATMTVDRLIRIFAGTFILIPQSASLPILLILAAGFGFGEAVVSSSTTALVADLSHIKTMGAGIGMQGTINDIGHAAA